MAKEVEPEEIIRLIDGVYKSIIEKFNPCARQLITAGKAYLKALQGATSASNVFTETLNKIAINAQQGTSSDIGDALINVVNVHKAIQEQHINILKAFYVDLLMPLENNLEKDTKIVQVEQKKFLQQHKSNVESYCKAVTTLKKQRKKKNASGTTSKELKSLQAVEEQKNKLKTYCNQSLKNALTQERRRYGFVLERQCSIAKHWMSYHNTGKTLLDNNLDDWQQIASTRENVTLNINEIFSKKKNGNKSDLESNSLLLRKTRSMEVAGGPDNKRDDRSFNQNSLPRTKSEHNLTMPSSTVSHNHRFSSTHSEELVEELLIMKAVYTYEANGKNQLNFEEGDRIALIGGRVNGWQFGENLRTKMMGWFPVTYLEKDNNNHHYNNNQNQHNNHYQQQQHHNTTVNNTTTNTNNHSNNHQYHNDQTPISTLKRGTNTKSISTDINVEPSPTRMFGDTIQFRNTRYFQKISAADLRTSPPPALPPPIPSVSGTGSTTAISANHLNSSQSFNFPKESLMVEKKRPIIYKGNKYSGHNNSEIEAPPQPEIDYSDEEEIAPTRVPLRQQHQNNNNNNNNNNDNIKRPLSSLLYDDDNSSPRNSSPQNHHHFNHNHHNTNNNNTSNNNNNNLADIDLNTLTRKDNFIKRTKSFWKTKKHDENLINNNNMSWHHNDIMNQQNNIQQQQQVQEQEDSMKTINDSEYEMELTHNTKNLNNDYSPKHLIKHKQQPLRNGGNNNNNNNKRNNKIDSMNFIDKNQYHNLQQQHQSNRQQHNHHNHNHFDSDESDNSTIKMSEINNKNNHLHNNNNHNFDDDSNLGLIKKPFKRREILKQYYNNNSDYDDDDDNDNDNNNTNNNNNNFEHNINHHHHHHPNQNQHNNINKNKINNNNNSNNNNKNNNGIIIDNDDDDDDRDDTDDDTDTEHDNDTTTSDPYDCIVIDDHLVKTKMEFKTFKGENHNINKSQQLQQQQQQQNKTKNKRNDFIDNKNNNNNNSNGLSNNKINNNNIKSINKTNNNNNNNSNSPSGTLLPRTKLNKSTSKESHLNRTIQQSTSTSSLLLNDNNNKMIMINNNNNNNNDKNGNFINIKTTTTTSSLSSTSHHQHHQQQHEYISDDSYHSKSYGPWYDLWDDKPHNVIKS